MRRLFRIFRDERGPTIVGGVFFIANCVLFQGKKHSSFVFFFNLDIDECKLPENNCEQICANLVGSFRCECNSGYELLPDKVNCTNINECIRQPDICANEPNTVCRDTNGSYVCECQNGYRRNLTNICDGMVSKFYFLRSS